MYDDILLNDNTENIVSNSAVSDIDSLFDNLSSDIENVNKFITNLNNKKKENSEEEKEIAEKVNVLGSENLAKTGCKIIHISTDYVFNGRNYKPYNTEDNVEPLSVYGKTKYFGEKAVLDNTNTAIVIRTAWLYSSSGKNFVKTMINLGKTRDSVNVVYDQVGTPTFAKDLAKAIVLILSQIKNGQKGIYHFTNEGVCSWYDFAVEIMSLYGLNCVVNPIKSSEYPTKAIRPFYSVLSKEKIKKDFGISVRHWKEALVECIKELKELNI